MIQQTCFTRDPTNHLASLPLGAKEADTPVQGHIALNPRSVRATRLILLTRVQSPRVQTVKPQTSNMRAWLLKPGPPSFSGIWASPSQKPWSLLRGTCSLGPLPQGPVTLLTSTNIASSPSDCKGPSQAKKIAYSSLWPHGSGQTGSSLGWCLVNPIEEGSVNDSRGLNLHISLLIKLYWNIATATHLHFIWPCFCSSIAE